MNSSEFSSEGASTHKTVSTMGILLADGDFGGLNPTFSLDRFIFFLIKQELSLSIGCVNEGADTENLK